MRLGEILLTYLITVISYGCSIHGTEDQLRLLNSCLSFKRVIHDYDVLASS